MGGGSELQMAEEIRVCTARPGSELNPSNSRAPPGGAYTPALVWGGSLAASHGVGMHPEDQFSPSAIPPVLLNCPLTFSKSLNF